jgi:bifunctional non-homologous end joining protein LigD
MVQQNCIDMNAWYSRVDKPTRPDFVLFDLDPPDGEFRLGVKAAHLVREALEGLELRSYVKTSGSEGIHILVPVTRRYGFPEAHRFAELVSKQLAAENPGVITTEWLKRKRVGVLIDYHQNGAGKTIASAYSVRPKEGAPVSTPLRWEEVTPRLDPGRFTMAAVLKRVEREGDLFEPVLRGGQSLGTALRRLERHSASQAAPRRPSQRGVRRT